MINEKRVLGISEEVTTCECCGRTGLKSTVIVGTDEGEAYYGSTCASYFVYGKRTRKDGDKIVTEARTNKIKIEHARNRFAHLWAISEAKDAGDLRPFLNWIASNGTWEPIDYDQLLSRLIDEYGKNAQGVF